MRAACAWFGHTTSSNVQRKAGAPLPPHPRAPVGAAPSLASLGRRATALCNDQRGSVGVARARARPSQFGRAFPRCRAFYYLMRVGTSVAHRPSNVQRPPRGQAGGPPRQPAWAAPPLRRASAPRPRGYSAFIALFDITPAAAGAFTFNHYVTTSRARPPRTSFEREPSPAAESLLAYMRVGAGASSPCPAACVAYMVASPPCP